MVPNLSTKYLIIVVFLPPFVSGSDGRIWCQTIGDPTRQEKYHTSDILCQTRKLFVKHRCKILLRYKTKYKSNSYHAWYILINDKLSWPKIGYSVLCLWVVNLWVQSKHMTTDRRSQQMGQGWALTERRHMWYCEIGVTRDQKIISTTHPHKWSACRVTRWVENIAEATWRALLSPSPCHFSLMPGSGIMMKRWTLATSCRWVNKFNGSPSR